MESQDNYYSTETKSTETVYRGTLMHFNTKNAYKYGLAGSVLLQTFIDEIGYIKFLRNPIIVDNKHFIEAGMGNMRDMFPYLTDNEIIEGLNSLIKQEVLVVIDDPQTFSTPLISLKNHELREDEIRDVYQGFYADFLTNEFIKNVKKGLKRKSGVYLLLSADKDVLYIGKSINLASRIIHSIKEKNRNNDIALVSWIECSVENMTDLESHLIIKANPKYNKLKRRSSLKAYELKNYTYSEPVKIFK